MQAPANTSKPKALCPSGPHLGRLVQVVDLGTQTFKGDSSRKLYLGFETSGTTHVFKDENGPEPFMLQAEFAFFMTSSNPQKKTKLRQFVESWFGKPFPSDQDASSFDFEKLLGRECLLTVAHQAKADGSLRAQIAGICLPMRGQVVPPIHNKTICYEITHGEGGDFKFLPNFLQKKIRESEEFTKGPQLPEDQGQPDYGNASEGYEPRSEPEIPEDDIPF